MSGTVAWCYVVLADPSQWQLPLWVVVVEYAPVYAMITYVMIRRRILNHDV